jgi:spectinomycin phosphotransferase
MPGRAGTRLSSLSPVKDRPEGVSERGLRRALAAGWGIRPATLAYAPVGAGSYHWVADDRWFVTVDDLDHKGWLGQTRSTVFGGLRKTLKTSRALRDQAGLEFVVAPELAVDGQPVRRFHPKYALAVYPLIGGVTGESGGELAAPARARRLDLLAALHQVRPAGLRWQVPVADPALALRGDLEAALGDLGTPWAGGPFAEPARALLAGSAGPIRALLADFDRLATRVAAASDLVITHGEPHPGNLLPTDHGLLLIDWDTVGLARPERDLWSVLDPGSDEARRYTAATGRPIDPAALWFYRIRWTLDDLAAFTRQLRAGHGDTGDAREAWQALAELAADAADQAGGHSPSGLPISHSWPNGSMIRPSRQPCSSATGDAATAPAASARAKLPSGSSTTSR